MIKSNTSSLAAQTQRMAFKERGQQVKTEVVNGTGMSPWEADVFIELLEQLYLSDPQLKPLKEGQLRAVCVPSVEGAGKPLEQCKKVGVTLTLLDAEDERNLQCVAGEGRMEEIRRQRICRMCEEAREQDGVLTQESLAKFLMCSVRIIRRGIDELKKDGIVVPTRGQQQDIGPTVSHRAPQPSGYRRITAGCHRECPLRPPTHHPVRRPRTPSRPHPQVTGKDCGGTSSGHFFACPDCSKRIRNHRPRYHVRCRRSCFVTAGRSDSP